MHADWHPFFTALVSASAALTGLVFVALSINLRTIVAQAQLVDRAGEAVALLVHPVVMGLVVLAPIRTTRRTGIVVLVVAVICWTLLTRLVSRGGAATGGRPRWEFYVRAALAEIATAPILVGAVVLIVGSSSGLGFLAVGAILSIVVGIIDAWVLLVEILR